MKSWFTNCVRSQDLRDARAASLRPLQIQYQIDQEDRERQVPRWQMI